MRNFKVSYFSFIYAVYRRHKNYSLFKQCYTIFFYNFKYTNIKYKIFQINFYLVVLFIFFIRYQLFVRGVTHK